MDSRLRSTVHELAHVPRQMTGFHQVCDCLDPLELDEGNRRIVGMLPLRPFRPTTNDVQAVPPFRKLNRLSLPMLMLVRNVRWFLGHAGECVDVWQEFI